MKVLTIRGIETRPLFYRLPVRGVLQDDLQGTETAGGEGSAVIIAVDCRKSVSA